MRLPSPHPHHASITAPHPGTSQLETEGLRWGCPHPSNCLSVGVVQLPSASASDRPLCVSPLLQMAVGPPDCPVGAPLAFPARGSGASVGAALTPLPPPKMPPHTILSTVPQQMFSDAGSGDDALDGDDDLVIDIPE